MGTEKQTANEKLSTTNNRITDLQAERDKSARAVQDMQARITDLLSKAATGERAYSDVAYAEDRDALSKSDLQLDRSEGLILSLKEALPELEAAALAEDLQSLEAKCRETCSVVNDEFQAFTNALLDLAQAFDDGLEASNKAHTMAVRDHMALSKRAAGAAGILIDNRIQLHSSIGQSLYTNKELQARSVIKAVREFSSMIKRGNLASADRLEKTASLDQPVAVAAP